MDTPLLDSVNAFVKVLWQPVLHAGQRGNASCNIGLCVRLDINVTIHEIDQQPPPNGFRRSKTRGSLGRLALSRWTGWSSGQVGRYVKCWKREWDGGGLGALSQRGFSSDKLFAEAPRFLVTPLLMGPVCLTSHGRCEEPVRPCLRPNY